MMSSKAAQGLMLLYLSLVLLTSCCRAFVPSARSLSTPSLTAPLLRPQSSLASASYVPPAPEEPAKPSKKKLYPKVGDLVRYYDVDGGIAEGEVLVGKISFIQKNLGQEKSGWTVELTELEDVGEGYFAEYPSRQRNSRKSLRDLGLVSPIAASFVRSESAFKVPISKETGQPIVRQEQYDIDDYQGPFSGADAIDQRIVEEDAITYGALKSKLLLYAAVTGIAGTLIADLVKGTEDAAIYAAGAIASLFYVFFLSIKTDSIASPTSKMGSNVSNVRFVMPVLVMVGIALYNQSRGDLNPVQGDNVFQQVTGEQFAAGIMGFLTYRLPLFYIQLQDSFREDAATALPGSAGVVAKLAQKEEEEDTVSFSADSLATVFLVSGPQATGRSKLVKRLISEGESRYIEPKKVDRIQEGATFERFEQRDELLSVDPSGRYGITKEGIVSAAQEAGTDSVVVIDADVDLAKKLAKVSGLRLVGVWVGLNSAEDFEKRLGALVDSGDLPIPEDETRESVIRARIREIVSEIEFGISSGIFEFTILNENEDESLKQLRAASSYCFK